MIKTTDHNAHPWRGKALVALFAATFALAGAGHALSPGTAAAYQSECDIEDWISCSEGPDTGNTESGNDSSGTEDCPFYDCWGEPPKTDEQGQSDSESGESEPGDSEPGDGPCGSCGTGNSGGGEVVGEGAPTGEYGYGGDGGSGSPKKGYWEPKDGWETLDEEEWWQSLSKAQRDEYERRMYVAKLTSVQLYNLRARRKVCERLETEARSWKEYGEYGKAAGLWVSIAVCWLDLKRELEDFIVHGPKIPPGRPTRPDPNKPPTRTWDRSRKAKHRHSSRAHGSSKR